MTDNSKIDRPLEDLIKEKNYTKKKFRKNIQAKNNAQNKQQNGNRNSFKPRDPNKFSTFKKDQRLPPINKPKPGSGITKKSQRQRIAPHQVQKNIRPFKPNKVPPTTSLPADLKIHIKNPNASKPPRPKNKNNNNNNTIPTISKNKQNKVTREPRVSKVIDNNTNTTQLLIQEFTGALRDVILPLQQQQLQHQTKSQSSSQNQLSRRSASDRRRTVAYTTTNETPEREIKHIPSSGGVKTLNQIFGAVSNHKAI